jgi:hypothetical protein
MLNVVKLISVFILAVCECRTISWRRDETSVLYFVQSQTKPWNITVASRANGDFYRDDIGHFRLQVSLFSSSLSSWILGTSECLDLTRNTAELKTSLSSTVLFPDSNNSGTRLLSIADVHIRKYGAKRRAIVEFLITGEDILLFDADVSFTDCSALRTVGDWFDPTNWVDGVVPSIADDVIFPESSGVVVISEDVTVRTLTMLGGSIVAQATGCPTGWSPWILNGIGCAL